MDDLDRAVIEKEIEYLLFVDHEDKLSMRRYVEFQPVVADLVELVVAHKEKAIKHTQDNLAYNVAKHLKEEVTKVVYNA